MILWNAVVDWLGVAPLERGQGWEWLSTETTLLPCGSMFPASDVSSAIYWLILHHQSLPASSTASTSHPAWLGSAPSPPLLELNEAFPWSPGASVGSALVVVGGVEPEASAVESSLLKRVAKLVMSGEGVLGIFDGGYDELLEMRIGGPTGLRSMMPSSGGVRRASGRRVEMPKLLNEGS